MLFLKLTITAAMCIVLSFFLGAALIPLLRRYNTGRYEPYVGDRFRTDGSEPAFGGAVTLIVLAFGISVAASYVTDRKRLLVFALFSALITAAGIADDVMTEVQGKACGVKTAVKLGYTYAVCLGTSLTAKFLGLTGSAVLLPFGLGFFEMGRAYCPVTAVFMTGVIYSFRIMNRFGTDEETCIGGLTQTVGAVSMLGVSLVGSITKNEALTAIGLVGAAAQAGYLLWGLSPSKLRSGSSGGYLTGAMTASVITLTDFYQLGMVLTAVSPAADAVGAAVNYLVYVSRKKLLLRASSLHRHISMYKVNDYKVIMIFSAAALAGAAAAAALAAYGQDRYF
ncbi:phospho-N-acetylmuramoyl-pentapeptide-transferase [Ruminococcus sp. YE71]|uniref:hypothetical protein n=1 Tax=unclassified Ruminococcus TaxID=2608920 RepID=UPI0008801D88|nr:MULTISPECIES: hypothetical protein [unclassified Ruminococcus]SDA11916.1 phospho-N-acetylmuramoyl-pentapeptide-transferase [Ruminococcus sp. YE78]SFW15949.1 phospho-N-acetylmuramoyl-pentapeptide-transferase [Ruminococcus sp. YE71]